MIKSRISNPFLIIFYNDAVQTVKNGATSRMGLPAEGQKSRPPRSHVRDIIW